MAGYLRIEEHLPVAVQGDGGAVRPQPFRALLCTPGVLAVGVLRGEAENLGDERNGNRGAVGLGHALHGLVPHLLHAQVCGEEVGRLVVGREGGKEKKATRCERRTHETGAQVRRLLVQSEEENVVAGGDG